MSSKDYSHKARSSTNNNFIHKPSLTVGLKLNLDEHDISQKKKMIILLRPTQVSPLNKPGKVYRSCVRPILLYYSET